MRRGSANAMPAGARAPRGQDPPPRRCAAASRRRAQLDSSAKGAKATRFKSSWGDLLPDGRPASPRAIASGNNNVRIAARSASATGLPADLGSPFTANPCATRRAHCRPDWERVGPRLSDWRISQIEAARAKSAARALAAGVQRPRPLIAKRARGREAHIVSVALPQAGRERRGRAVTARRHARREERGSQTEDIVDAKGRPGAIDSKRSQLAARHRCFFLFFGGGEGGGGGGRRGGGGWGREGG